ncbi:MAG: adenosine kinase [Candidatus Woesearchaeota archaeon]
MYDVIGISHPLVDVYAHVDDSFLEQCGLEKGQFSLVSEEMIVSIQKALDGQKFETSPGGSVPNVLYHLSLLDCKVTEFGKVGDDDFGKLLKKCVHTYYRDDFLSVSQYPTGTVLALITPDAERTFAVCLGAASQLTVEDIDMSRVQKTRILHTSGYEFESPHVSKALRAAVASARESDVLVSFDLADPGVVQRNLIEMKAFLEHNVDIVFANKEEAVEFTGKLPEEAVLALTKHARYAVVKCGAEGSYVADGVTGAVHYIEAYSAQAVDTTGAGDVYAAVFLHGILHEMPLDEVGKRASYIASQVVAQTGARLKKIDFSLMY